MADDLDPNQSPNSDALNAVQAVAPAVPADPTDPIPTEPPAEPLPTMADLDRVASELDEIDARLAALDEQRP